MSTHNICFQQKYEKYQEFLSENFQFFGVKFSIYLNRCVFVMDRSNAVLLLQYFFVCKVLQLCRCVLSLFVPQLFFFSLPREVYFPGSCHLFFC